MYFGCIYLLYIDGVDDYNTGNYATTIEDRTTDDKQINYKVDPG